MTWLICACGRLLAATVGGGGTRMGAMYVKMGWDCCMVMVVSGGGLW